MLIFFPPIRKQTRTWYCIKHSRNFRSSRLKFYIFFKLLWHRLDIFRFRVIEKVMFSKSKSYSIILYCFFVRGIYYLADSRRVRKICKISTVRIWKFHFSLVFLANVKVLQMEKNTQKQFIFIEATSHIWIHWLHSWRTSQTLKLILKQANTHIRLKCCYL